MAIPPTVFPDIFGTWFVEQPDGGAVVLGHRVSAEDFDLIRDYREHACSVRHESALTDVRQLSDVSVAFPATVFNGCSWVLEHSLTRDWIGYVEHARTSRRRGGRVPKTMLEFAIALVRRQPNLFFEYFRFPADAQRIFVQLNGQELATLLLPVRQKGWRNYWKNRVPTDVFVGGRHFGAIRVEWPKWRLTYELHLDRGGVLELPYTFGHTSREVLLIIVRLLLLTPLWSRHMPPNNSRVIDCPPGVELTDAELTVYFAVALFIRVSLHGHSS